MNQKEFSKNCTSKNGAIYPGKKRSAVYNRFYQSIKALAERNPKITVIAMLAFATINVVIMFYIVNTAPPLPLIPKNIGKAITDNNTGRSEPVSFNFSNFMKISKLKDSMDYLMKQPHLSKKDSLLFIRICDEYAKLDPTFFKQVKEAIHKKNNPNYENNH
jgi:hypothetical protein